MKHLNILLFLIGASLFFFGCSKDDTDPVSDLKREATIFTGTEDPVETRNEGVWTPQPSGLLLGEGGVFEYRIESTEPRITGKIVYYTCALFDTNFFGQYWGTGEVIPDNGGSWDIMFIGERPVTGGSGGEIVAHGEGVLDGLIAQWKFYVLPGETQGGVEGFIVEP